jgi:hypothetical protein
MQAKNLGGSMGSMTKTALIVLITAIFFSSTALVLNGDETSYKALLGNWDIEADAGGQVFTFVFQFTLDNGVLKGKLTFDMGEGEMTDLTFDGKKLTFSVSLDVNGQVIDLSADAEVDGQKISGTLVADMGEATFIGEKQKEE